MSRTFTYQGSAAHIVFGEGRAETAGEWIEKLGRRKALVLSTPHQKADAEELAVKLGALAAGVFPGAVMHTPVDVTQTPPAPTGGPWQANVSDSFRGSVAGQQGRIAFQVKRILPQDQGSEMLRSRLDVGSSGPGSFTSSARCLSEEVTP